MWGRLPRSACAHHGRKHRSARARSDARTLARSHARLQDAQIRFGLCAEKVFVFSCHARMPSRSMRHMAFMLHVASMLCVRTCMLAAATWIALLAFAPVFFVLKLVDATSPTRLWSSVVQQMGVGRGVLECQ